MFLEYKNKICNMNSKNKIVSSSTLNKTTSITLTHFTRRFIWPQETSQKDQVYSETASLRPDSISKYPRLD